jgi:hypothetical protein
MPGIDKREGITREELEDEIWGSRGSEYVLIDDREEFSMEDIVRVTHNPVNPSIGPHSVKFKTEHLIGRSAPCPACHPEMQHDYGIKILRDYFQNRLGLAESELEEGTIETDELTDDEGNPLYPSTTFDFLVHGKLVVHYFDPSYFTNFTKESEEMLLLMAEFVDSRDYDLLPVTFTDIKEIEKGGDLIFDDGEEEEETE